MKGLKITAIIVSLLIASLGYILLTRYFPSEEVLFMGSGPLKRALVVDLKVKSNKEFPTFLPQDTGFLVIHPNHSPDNHQDDIIETRRIFTLIAKTDKNEVDASDPLYEELEVLFLKHNLVGVRASYMTLANVGIKSIFFNPDYLSQFATLYQDKLPHVAGYAVMADGSQRLIRDILVK